MTKHRSVDDVDIDVFVVPTGPSNSTGVRAHLPAVSADGSVLPLCQQANRTDREWETRRREHLPLAADGVCIECDPERKKATRDMDFSYQDALKRAAKRNQEVAD